MSFVKVRVPREDAIEFPRVASGRTHDQDTVGLATFHGLIDRILNGLSLVNDDHQVLRMETLEAAWVICAETNDPRVQCRHSQVSLIDLNSQAFDLV